MLGATSSCKSTQCHLPLPSLASDTLIKCQVLRRMVKECGPPLKVTNRTDQQPNIALVAHMPGTHSTSARGYEHQTKRSNSGIFQVHPDSCRKQMSSRTSSGRGITVAPTFSKTRISCPCRTRNSGVIPSRDPINDANAIGTD